MSAMCQHRTNCQKSAVTTVGVVTIGWRGSALLLEGTDTIERIGPVTARAGHVWRSGVVPYDVKCIVAAVCTDGTHDIPPAFPRALFESPGVFGISLLSIFQE